MALPRTRAEAERDLPGKAFTELEPAWKNDMAAVRPLPGQAFTKEQRSLLKGFYLVIPENRLQQLRDAQQGATIRLEPINLNGTWLIPADCLTAIRDGDVFGRLAGFLTSLKFVLVSDSDWPTSTLP